MSTETKALLVRMPLSLHQWVTAVATRTGESAASLMRTALRSELFRREEELEIQEGHTNLGLCTREDPCCEEPQVINLRKHAHTCTCLCHG